jgi:hypothetical protein
MAFSLEFDASVSRGELPVDFGFTRVAFLFPCGDQGIAATECSIPFPPAMFIQLPCFGVLWISSREASARAVAGSKASYRLPIQ